MLRIILAAIVVIAACHSPPPACDQETCAKGTVCVSGGGQPACVPICAFGDGGVPDGGALAASLLDGGCPGGCSCAAASWGQPADDLICVDADNFPCSL